MTILRSGANQKYSDNWSKAFGAKKKSTVAKAKSIAKKKTKKKTTAKSKKR